MNFNFLPLWRSLNWYNRYNTIQTTFFYFRCAKWISSHFLHPFWHNLLIFCHNGILAIWAAVEVLLAFSRGTLNFTSIFAVFWCQSKCQTNVPAPLRVRSNFSAPQHMFSAPQQFSLTKSLFQVLFLMQSVTSMYHTSDCWITVMSLFNMKGSLFTLTNKVLSTRRVFTKFIDLQPQLLLIITLK